MLHRLHASEVRGGCVSSFVPCISPYSKPFPLQAPLLIYMFTLKGGGEWRGGNSSVFDVSAYHFTEFSCHS